MAKMFIKKINDHLIIIKNEILTSCLNNKINVLLNMFLLNKYF